ncbi:hypothetical protein DH86_00002108 [Scytalidium sp. 3C]|nr:hypothetical protein DH86_00002108 [Scytalidium sp. 3C]
MYIEPMSKEELKRAGGYDVQKREAFLLGTGDEKVSLTTMSDVGKFVVAALRHPEASNNRALKVNSYTTTPKEILAEFEKQTGQTWKVSYTPLDELKKLEQEAWEGGNPAATVFTLRRIWTEGGTLYESTDNKAIGVDETDTLETTVRNAIQSGGKSSH